MAARASRPRSRSPGSVRGWPGVQVAVSQSRECPWVPGRPGRGLAVQGVSVGARASRSRSNDPTTETFAGAAADVDIRVAEHVGHHFTDDVADLLPVHRPTDRLPVSRRLVIPVRTSSLMTSIDFRCFVALYQTRDDADDLLPVTTQAKLIMTSSIGRLPVPGRLVPHGCRWP